MAYFDGVVHLFTLVKVWDIDGGRDAVAAAQGHHHGRGTKAAAREFLPELRGSGGAFSKFQALPLVARYRSQKRKREGGQLCPAETKSDSSDDARDVASVSWYPEEGIVAELSKGRCSTGQNRQGEYLLTRAPEKWQLNRLPSRSSSRQVCGEGWVPNTSRLATPPSPPTRL